MKKYYVYRFTDSDNEIIYVGKTINFKNRMKQHFSRNGHLPKECYDSVCKIEYIEVYHQIDMTIYELYYISEYRPKYNTNDILDDNKSDIATITDNNKWIISDFLESNINNVTDIKTLDLDMFVGKYIIDVRSKKLEAILADRYIYIREFHKLLESYQLVGQVGNEYKFYTECAINQMLKKYDLKYKILFDRKRLENCGNKSYRIHEVIKI